VGAPGCMGLKGEGKGKDELGKSEPFGGRLPEEGTNKSVKSSGKKKWLTKKEVSGNPTSNYSGGMQNEKTSA